MSIAEKLTAIADNVPKIYNAGYEAGKSEGGDTDAAYNEGVEAGKKAEYDAFWNAYQPNGSRLTGYVGAFAGSRWTADSFRPKYDIAVIDGGQIFWANIMAIDLAQHLEECGVKLDLSQSNSSGSMFAFSKFTRIGELTLNNRQYTSMFNSCVNLKTIDKIIMREGTAIPGAFSGCTALESIMFDGVIATNGVDISPCTLLSHNSLMSIINILKDYSGSGNTYTVKFGTTNLAKLTDAEKAIATQKGWTLA